MDNGEEYVEYVEPIDRLIRDLQLEHGRRVETLGRGDVCAKCDVLWPCRTARVVTHLKLELEQRKEMESVTAGLDCASLVAEAKRAHILREMKPPPNFGLICRACEMVWPCPTLQLATQLEQEETLRHEAGPYLLRDVRLKAARTALMLISIGAVPYRPDAADHSRLAADFMQAVATSALKEMGEIDEDGFVVVEGENGG